MSFVNLVLLLMVAMMLLTVVPVYIIGKLPTSRFLGFYYDDPKKMVVPPLWLIVLYSVFFVFFSSSYLYFWVKEMTYGSYNPRYFLFDALLFFGVIYFVTIPLVQKTLAKFIEKLTAK